LPLVKRKTQPGGDSYKFEFIFIPIMSNTRKYWLFQLGGWGLFTLVNIFFAFVFNHLSEVNFYLRLLIFIGLGVILSHLMRQVIVSAGVLLKPLNRQILSFVVITLVFAVVIGVAESYLQSAIDLTPIDRETNRQIAMHKVILTNTFYSFIYLFIWNSIYFMYHYISKSQRQQLDTLRLEAMVKELELKTIKAHINPHFIFNSLNSIRALIDENPGRARNAVTELSNILRSSMQAEKLELVPFEKELNIVKDYLALENMRFEDRLKVEYEIDEDTLEQTVPPMMLQTLVENAIKHGISRRLDGGVIRVVSDFRDNFHELVVQNTGELNGQTIDQEGFGISSTVNRINLLYGEKARFIIRQIAPQLVEAKVLIPVLV